MALCSSMHGLTKGHSLCVGTWYVVCACRLSASWGPSCLTIRIHMIDVVVVQVPAVVDYVGVPRTESL